VSDGAGAASLHDDFRNVKNLRLQIATLCSTLRSIAARLRDGSLVVSDLRDDFDCRYQPDAIRLATAMKQCLASGDSWLIHIDDPFPPLINDLTDRISSGEPLLENPQLAAVQLETVVSILHRALFFTEKALTASPPQEQLRDGF
jgi:hypothetical protein